MIRIRAGAVEVTAELNDTRTAQVIWQALPVTATAQTWGDEIYFSIPVNLSQENAREVVEKGDLGYWPPGQAMCLFFGPTPVSRGNEIRPASPVNIFGQIIGDTAILKKVRGGTQILVEKAGS